MHQPESKIYAFRCFKTSKSSVLKDLQIKIGEGGYSRFENF